MLKAFRGTSAARLWSIDAFGSSFSGGLSLAAFTPSQAQTSQPRTAEVVVGAGAGGGSQVKVFDAAKGALLATFLGATGSNAVEVAAG